MRLPWSDAYSVIVDFSTAFVIRVCTDRARRAQGSGEENTFAIRTPSSRLCVGVKEIRKSFKIKYVRPVSSSSSSYIVIAVAIKKYGCTHAEKTACRVRDVLILLNSHIFTRRATTAFSDLSDYNGTFVFATRYASACIYIRNIIYYCVRGLLCTGATRISSSIVFYPNENGTRRRPRVRARYVVFKSPSTGR